MSFLEWRPKVSEWGEVAVPHLAAPIDVPRRIEWKGVEYDCVLAERED